MGVRLYYKEWEASLPDIKRKFLTPKTRVKMAWWLLLSTLVLTPINVAAYLMKWIDESMLILITLVLSWFAITLTALDILSTQDVRQNQDD